MTTYNRDEVTRVRDFILIFSLAAWFLLLFEVDRIKLLAHCPDSSSSTTTTFSSVEMSLKMRSPGSLIAGWALMLIAMMLPVLMAPICQLRLESFAYRRNRATVLFLVGYFGIWMAFGPALMTIELASTLIAPRSFLPIAGLAAVALIWQSSPFKQLCLNRCHTHPNLAAFGTAADTDAVRFGLTHGIWCIGSCWAWMLIPMLMPKGHDAAMVIVAVLVFSERLEEARWPRWGWRGTAKVCRLALAQMRIACKRTESVFFSRFPMLRNYGW